MESIRTVYGEMKHLSKQESSGISRLRNSSFLSTSSPSASPYDPFYDVMDVFEGGKNRDRRSFSDTLENSHYSGSARSLTGLASSHYIGSKKAAHLGRVVYTGWLTKQGHVWKSWKKRFFVLQTRPNPGSGKSCGSLQYYKNNKFGKLKGEISLADVPITVRFLDIQKTGRPYCFEIVRGFYTLICQGRDEQDAEAWVGHLQDVLSSGTESSESGMAPLLNRTMRTSSFGDMFCQNISVELRRLLDNTRSPEGNKCSAFIKNFDYRSANAVLDVRKFICHLMEVILNNHSDKFVSMMGGSTDDSSLAAVSRIVTRHLEETVFLPLHDGIYSCLRRVIPEDAEEKVNTKIHWLHGKDQSFFDIPLNQMSWSKWKMPVTTLRLMGTYSLPSDKFETLVQTVKEVHKCYLDEHPSDGRKVLNLDDLLPIFTYVLVNSGLENLLITKELLFTMCQGGNSDDSEEICVELRIFAASLDYIMNVSIPAVFEDIFTEQVSVVVDGEWKLGIELEEETTYHRGAVVKAITSNGQSALNGVVAKGYVLVSVQGQHVILRRYSDILSILSRSQPPHRLAFIAPLQYFRILATNSSLWNDALLQSARKGNIEDLQILLANGASINCTDKNGNTPLHLAAGELHFGAVSYLVQHGAKVKSLGEEGRTPLHMVGCPPTPEVVDPLNPFTVSQERDETVARSVINKLIRSGAVIDALDIYGNTPLMLLAKSGSVEGVEALASAGAAVDARNWSAGYTPLALATLEAAPQVVERLLNRGANPNLATLDGSTPLHIAAATANVEICRLLAEKKAVINARSNSGIIPLVMALSRGRFYAGTDLERIHVDDASVLDTIKFLIENGADINYVCQRYRQPLHYSALHGSPDMVRMLLKEGADVNARDINGYSPLNLVERELEAEIEGEITERRSYQLSDWEQIQGILMGEMQVSKDISSFNFGANVRTFMSKGRREIEAAALEDLVGHLITPANFLEVDIEAFLCAGSHFCSSLRLLEILKDYFERCCGSGDRRQIRDLRRTILIWLDLWVQLIETKTNKDRGWLSQFISFAEDLVQSVENEDPSASQWLSYVHLPKFIKAYNNPGAKSRHFAKILPCNWVYSRLSPLIEGEEEDPSGDTNTDDDLGRSSGEPSEEEVRRQKRLQIAGVLDEPPKIQVVADSDSFSNTKSTVRLRSETSVFERVERFWLLGCDPAHVAQQITLVEHFLFQSVPVQELVYSKKHASGTLGYEKLRSFHNHCSLWVVNQILGRNEAADRALALGFFVAVAWKCCTPLKNYDGFMAIMNALNDSSIFRLKLTWGRLSQDAREQWNNLKKITESGARSLNKFMKDAAPPSVPYIGIILQNLISYQEYPDYIEENVINFKKIKARGGVAAKVRRLQRTPYLFGPDQKLLEYIQAPLQYSSKESCFDRSLEVEPRIGTVRK